MGGVQKHKPFHIKSVTDKYIYMYILYLLIKEPLLALIARLVIIKHKIIVKYDFNKIIKSFDAEEMRERKKNKNYFASSDEFSIHCSYC